MCKLRLKGSEIIHKPIPWTLKLWRSIAFFPTTGMNILQKLISFTLHATFVVLFVPAASSLGPMGSKESNYSPSKHQPDKIGHQLSSEITVHGFLLWSAMGLLTPVGILTMRMANKFECSRRRRKLVFYFHAGFQMLSVLFSTIGAVLSIKNFNNSFDNHHQKIGVGLYGIIWLQALIGVLRPHRGSKGRSLWFLLHWILGTIASLLGVINVYTGLIAYHEKTSKSIRLWTILYTIEISLVGLIFLLQEKWVYIQRQHSNELIRQTEIISLGENQKVLTIESC